MGYWFHKYPGTNFHEQNIDWITESIGALKEEFKNFKVVNTIRYAGVWDITKQYGVSNIVTDNDIGYIAIQPVPASIAITNTDYWIPIADFYPQIAALGLRVDALEAADIRINNAISNLRKSNAMQNKRVLVLGDSYAYADYLDGNPYPADGYVKLLQGYLDIANDNYFYIGVPGARIYSLNDDTVRMLSIAQGYEASVTDPDTIDIVIVQSGINDRDNAQADIISAWGDLADYLKATYPKAKLYSFMTYGSFQSRDLVDNTFADNAATVYAGYAYGCSRNDVCLFTESSYPLAFKSNFYTDNYHPNSSGHAAIATIMAARLLGSDEYPYGNMYQEVDSSSFTITNSDVTAATVFNGYAWHKDNKMCMFNNPSMISITLDDVGINCNGSASIELGYFNDIRFSVNSLGWNETHSYPCIIQETGGDFRPGTLMLDFRLGKVLARLMVPTASGYLDSSTTMQKIYYCPTYTEFRSYPW